MLDVLCLSLSCKSRLNCITICESVITISILKRKFVSTKQRKVAKLQTGYSSSFSIISWFSYTALFCWIWQNCLQVHVITCNPFEIECFGQPKLTNLNGILTFLMWLGIWNVAIYFQKWLSIWKLSGWR